MLPAEDPKRPRHESVRSMATWRAEGVGNEYWMVEEKLAVHLLATVS